jgi:hypothetical protein
VTEPVEQRGGAENLPDVSTRPGDIASAARSCQIILLILAAVLLLLCVAFGVSKLV